MDSLDRDYPACETESDVIPFVECSFEECDAFFIESVSEMGDFFSTHSHGDVEVHHMLGRRDEIVYGIENLLHVFTICTVIFDIRMFLQSFF